MNVSHVLIKQTTLQIRGSNFTGEFPFGIFVAMNYACFQKDDQFVVENISGTTIRKGKSDGCIHSSLLFSVEKIFREEKIQFSSRIFFPFPETAHDAQTSCL